MGKLNKRRGRRVSDLIQRGDALICHWCKQQVEKVPPHHTGTDIAPNAATVDHVHPIGSGGMDRLFNCVMACYKCNQTRGKPLSVCTLEEQEFRKSIISEENRLLEKYHARVQKLLEEMCICFQR